MHLTRNMRKLIDWVFTLSFCAVTIVIVLIFLLSLFGKMSNRDKLVGILFDNYKIIVGYLIARMVGKIAT